MQTNKRKNAKPQGKPPAREKVDLSTCGNYAEMFCSKCTGRYFVENGWEDRSTCPYTGADEHKQTSCTSYSQAMSWLSGVAPYAVAKLWREMQACEFLWGFDQSGKPAAVSVEKGSYVKGIKEAGSRTIWQTSYQLTKVQLSALQADHPGYWFLTGLEHHDHPISHINTQIVTRGLMDRMERTYQNSKVLDLHGNPAANAKNRQHRGLDIDTVVERITPRDYQRAATKWGNWTADPHVFESAMRDFTLHPTPDWDDRITGYQAFLSVHTLYYYSREELCSLMNKRDGSVLYAVIHKHDGNKGTMSHGEMEYVRETVMGRDWIRQTNVLTGETYHHPSTDWLFKGANSWHDDVQGMSWTLQKCGTDSYLVTFTGCPPSQCRMDSLGENSKADSWMVVESAVELEIGGETRAFSKVDTLSADTMRATVSGKARTADQFKDHLAGTKRTMKKNGTLGTHSPCETAVYSFLVDFNEELEQTGLLTEIRAGRRTFLKNLDGTVHLDELNLLDKLLTVALHCADNSNSPKKLGVGLIRMAQIGVRTGGNVIQQ